MSSKSEKNFDRLKQDLQLLTREEMKKIKGGRAEIRFSARWTPHCSGPVRQ